MITPPKIRALIANMKASRASEFQRGSRGVFGF